MMNRSKGFYKVISVIIAITLWSYVIVTSEPTTTRTISDVPVHLINIENLTARELSVSGDLNYTVDVKVKGRRAEVLKVKAEQILANADLFGFTPGKNYIPVTVTVPESLQIVDVTDGKIIVNIEELVAESKPVVVSFAGEFKDGREAGNVSTQPEAIEVSGPKSIVQQVDYIRAEVSASQVKSGGSELQIEAEPVNADGETVTGVTLSSKIVEVSAKLMKVKEVELEVPIEGEISNAYEVTKMSYPKKVTIRGEEEEVDKVDKISANAINIANVTTNTSFPIVPILPEGIELGESSQGMSLAISLKGITTKTFDYSAFEIVTEEVPETLNLSVETAKFQIKVTGNEAALNQMNKSDFVPYINLKDATTEITEVEVFVRHNQKVTTVTVVPEKINISLREVE